MEPGLTAESSGQRWDRRLSSASANYSASINLFSLLTNPTECNPMTLTHTHHSLTLLGATVCLHMQKNIPHNIKKCEHKRNYQGVKYLTSCTSSTCNSFYLPLRGVTDSTPISGQYLQFASFHMCGGTRFLCSFTSRHGSPYPVSSGCHGNS